MKNNLTLRTNTFAHDCVKVALLLPKNDLGGHIKRQLIRCATSTAANYRAASLGQTKKSFVAKLSIVVEESDECIFWIAFLAKEGLLPPENYESVLNEAKELTAIFIASRITAQKNSNR